MGALVPLHTDLDARVRGDSEETEFVCFALTIAPVSCLYAPELGIHITQSSETTNEHNLLSKSFETCRS